MCVENMAASVARSGYDAAGICAWSTWLAVLPEVAVILQGDM